MFIFIIIIYYYYYWYSALGPVWPETRVQSGDWYGSGTLHPGQVLRGSLPLLSPGCSYILFIIIIGGILVLFMYITIFSPSNKIHREVGRAKDLTSTPVAINLALNLVPLGGRVVATPRVYILSLSLQYQFSYIFLCT